MNVTVKVPTSLYTLGPGTSSVELVPSPKFQRTVTESPSGSLTLPANVTDCPTSMVTLPGGWTMTPFGGPIPSTQM